MELTLTYKDLSIIITDKTTEDIKPGKREKYDHIYQQHKDAAYTPISRHAVKICRGKILITEVLLLGAAGATGITSDMAIIDDDHLIIHCCNVLFSLTLPDLHLNWMMEADWATCFGVHLHENTYITWGETSITRIDRNGKMLWSFSAADIFVCLYEGNPFEMHSDYIALTDFQGNKYKINYDGQSYNSK